MWVGCFSAHFHMMGQQPRHEAADHPAAAGCGPCIGVVRPSSSIQLRLQKNSQFLSKFRLTASPRLVFCAIHSRGVLPIFRKLRTEGAASQTL